MKKTPLFGAPLRHKKKLRHEMPVPDSLKVAAPVFGGGVPTFAAPNPVTTGMPSLMAEAVAPVAPSGVSNSVLPPDRMLVSDIAFELFDGLTDLALKTLKAFGITPDAQDTVSQDDFYSALADQGIPDDVEKTYEQSPMSEKRVADEFFAGNAGSAETFLKKAGLKPDSNGRYDYNALIGGLADTDTVFSESARQHAKKKAKERSYFLAESSASATRKRGNAKIQRQEERRRQTPDLVAEEAISALLESVGKPANKPTRSAAPVRTPPLAVAKKQIADATGINRAGDKTGSRRDGLGNDRTFSLMTESAPASQKIHLETALDKYFGGSMQRMSTAMNAFGLTKSYDSRGNYMLAEVAYVAKQSGACA